MAKYFDDPKEERRWKWEQKKGSKKHNKEFVKWKNPRYPRDEEVEILEEDIYLDDFTDEE